MTSTTTTTTDSAMASLNDDTTKVMLLDRLGGDAALKAVVYEFYGRILNDSRLEYFFAGTDMKALRKHQEAFLKIAFTAIPEDLDVAALIADKHRHLFDNKGLNETHFDLVAEHLMGTLEHLGVSKELMEEVGAIVIPLREVFANNAKKTPEEERKEQLLDRLGGPAALKATVYEFYGRILADEQLAPFFEHTDMKKLREHQYKFLELAFTQVPEGMDVAKLIEEKHERLFERGLNATHFDLVAGHLVATLQHLNVAQPLIDEVVATVGPLRPIFDKGNSN